MNGQNPALSANLAELLNQAVDPAGSLRGYAINIRISPLIQLKAFLHRVSVGRCIIFFKNSSEFKDLMLRT